MIKPMTHSFSHLGISNYQSTSGPTYHTAAPEPAISSEMVPNFVSRGRAGKVPLTHFDTLDERNLAFQQEQVIRSIDGKEFMRLLQKYTASETTREEFATLRAAIPRYSVDLARPGSSKVLYRGISLGRDCVPGLLRLPTGFESRGVIHGLIHGRQMSNGSYTGRGVASASTVSAISEGFALLNAREKKQIPVLFVLKAMGPVYKDNHSGARGVTLSTSRLPLAAGGKSEHEVILDITNRYEVTRSFLEGERVTIEINVLGRSKRGVELSAYETDKWQQLSEAKGSNPGGLFLAPDRVKWYVKTGHSRDHFRNEVLASKLYAAAGLTVPTLRLATKGGNPALISKFIDSHKKDLEAMKKNQQLMQGFAVDAWLANWDVAGLDLDNILFTPDNKPVRIDLGGALIFRARGERKGDQFGRTPEELFTMLSRKDNTSSSVFQKITRDQIRAGINAIANIPDAHIARLCQEHGPGTARDRAVLGDLMLRRKKWLIDMSYALPHIHHQTDEQGNVMVIKKPTSPSSIDTWHDHNEIAVFVHHKHANGSLNGIPLTPWNAPKTASEWRRIRTHAIDFTEPEFKKSNHLNSASGAVIFEPDGRCWIVEPTNHAFDTHTFPKGGLERGLSLATNAVKEVYEETGLRVLLHGFIGDYDRSTSRTRYYLAKRIGGTPSAMGHESQSVKLATPADAGDLLNNVKDLKVVLDAVKFFDKHHFKQAWSH